MKRRILFFKHLVVTFIVASGVILFQNGCSTTSGVTTGGTTGGVLLNHDRRTAKALVDDQAIDVKANVTIVKEKEIWKQSHISTMSYNGSLLLVGQIPSENLKARIEKVLAEIPGVKKVYNQLRVTLNINFSSRVKDAWLTTQVKAKLVAARDIGPNRVKVLTEDSKVYLMGILTKDEIEIATDVVKKVKGIDEIITIFDDFLVVKK